MTKSELWSILTEAEAKRIMSRVENGSSHDPMVCCFCGELIQIDDCFIRKRRSGLFRIAVVRYYHEKCWKKLLH